MASAPNLFLSAQNLASCARGGDSACQLGFRGREGGEEEEEEEDLVDAGLERVRRREVPLDAVVDAEAEDVVVPADLLLHHAAARHRRLRSFLSLSLASFFGEKKGRRIIFGLDALYIRGSPCLTLTQFPLPGGLVWAGPAQPDCCMDGQRDIRIRQQLIKFLVGFFFSREFTCAHNLSTYYMQFARILGQIYQVITKCTMHDVYFI